VLRCCFLVTGTVLFATSSASAQALPTAQVGIFPSAFVGASGINTGYDSGENVAITGGVDIGVYSARRFEYAVEYRGTYTVWQSGIDSEKSSYIGAVLARRQGRWHPYGDILVGRVETDFSGIGAQVPNTIVFYTKSSSNAFAGGGGANYDLGSHFAVKLDALVQRFSSPVTTSGHAYPISGTVALVYNVRPRRSPKDHTPKLPRTKPSDAKPATGNPN
jgi:hypothetical protein